MKAVLLLTFISVFVFILNSCSKNPVTGKQDFMLMSKQKEIQMGKQSDPDIITFFGLYDDKQLQQFIQHKGREMVAVSHRQNHEMGYITARHSAKKYSQQMLAQLGLVAGMVVSEEFRQFADLAQTG